MTNIKNINNIPKDDLKRLRSIYNNMMSRCYNPKQINYKYYGGKGITVCDRWRESFQNFVEDMYNENYSPEKTLDRIDSKKGYGPDNCRWSTIKEQAFNRSNNVYVKYRGELKPLAELCEIYNQNKSVAWKRIFRYNWSVERALRVEPRKRKVKK